MKGRRIKPAIVPDATWPRMYRIQLPDGSLTDMLNRSRAKEVLAGGVEQLAAPRPRPASERHHTRPSDGNPTGKVNLARAKKALADLLQRPERLAKVLASPGRGSP